MRSLLFKVYVIERQLDFSSFDKVPYIPNPKTLIIFSISDTFTTYTGIGLRYNEVASDEDIMNVADTKHYHFVDTEILSSNSINPLEV